MSEDNVTRPNFGESRVTVEPGKTRLCLHTHVVIRGRVVICRVCHQGVDPIEILQSLSRDWDWATHLEQQREDRLRRVEELKAEESNVKARVKKGYLGAESPRAELFMAEATRRLRAVRSASDLHEYYAWLNRFPWISPKEKKRYEEELAAASERCMKQQKADSRARKRGLRVVEGSRGKKT